MGTIYVRLAVLYCTIGRAGRSAGNVFSQGRAADPLCPVLPSTETFVRLCRREYDAALACGKNALDLHPYQHMGRAHYAQALEATGQIDEALAQHRLVCVMSPDLAWLHGAGSGLSCQERAPRPGGGDSRSATGDSGDRISGRVFHGLLLEALGRRDAAFEELERAHQERSATLFMLNVDWRMDGLRQDKRFKPLQQN